MVDVDNASIDISQNVSITFTLNNSNYEVLVYGSVSTFKGNTQIKAESFVGSPAVKSVSTASSVVAQSASSDSVIAYTLVGIAVASDFSGTLMQFTKMIQMLNKLSYINLNYGSIMKSYLSLSSSSYKRGSSNQQVYNTLNYRGKLSKEMVTLDVIGFMAMKLVVYRISFIVCYICRCLTRSSAVLSKGTIYLCHYSNKVHQVVFNLTFVDFVWLAPRTLMHSQKLALAKINIAFITSIMICVDFWYIYLHLTDNRVWRLALEYNTFMKTLKSSKPEKTKITIGEKDKKEDNKEIDYIKTYERVNMNSHFMLSCTVNYSLSWSVYSSKLCRILLFYSYVRTALIPLVITVGQYCVVFCLIILIAIEIMRLFATLWAYLKYKHLKTSVSLLIEISQSAFLASFLILMLLIDEFVEGNDLNSSYQYVAVFIIIVSCATEYLMLVIYISINTYQFFRFRNLMKKDGLEKQKYQLIAYYKSDDSMIFFPSRNSPKSKVRNQNNIRASPITIDSSIL